ncbi:S-adenosyl-L-methionine-dependent methyltransferase [Pavlovales sp. CCMP2436]|nr:S-adenosyl-L-methionine-dependent methyltransferase [Pavlovales sp. CCMP2436]
MGWTSSGPTNRALVDNLIRDGIVRDRRVEAALRAVDRADFCFPYEDHPLPIGFEQTISAPHMHAHALELLKAQLVDGAQVLDVGCGSGFLTATFAQMLRTADGWIGVPGSAFDAIHVGAAAEFVPAALVAQLKPGGRMIIPVGRQHLGQVLMDIDKRADVQLVEHEMMEVRYVPLVKSGYY